MVLDHADPVGQYAVIQKKLLGPAGPKVKEPLALLVLNHADPAGQRVAIQSTMSLWERLPAQSEPPCGDGLVERISDEEPTVCQVSGGGPHLFRILVLVVLKKSRNTPSTDIVLMLFISSPLYSARTQSWSRAPKCSGYQGRE